MLGYCLAQSACAHATADVEYFDDEFRERALEGDPIPGALRELSEDGRKDLEARLYGVDASRTEPIGTVSYGDIMAAAPWLTPYQAEAALDDVASGQQGIERELDGDIDYRCWRDGEGTLWFPESSVKGIMASFERTGSDPMRLVDGRVVEYTEVTRTDGEGKETYPLLPTRTCEPHTAPNGETVWDAANDFVWDRREAPARGTELGERVWRGKEADALCGFFTADDLFKAYCADPGLDEQRLAGTTLETWVAEMEKMDLLAVAATTRLGDQVAVAGGDGNLSAELVSVDADDAFVQHGGGYGLTAWESRDDEGSTLWFRKDAVADIQAELARSGGAPLVWEGEQLVQYGPVDTGKGPDTRPVCAMAPSLSPLGEKCWPAAQVMGWEVTMRDGEPVAGNGMEVVAVQAVGAVEARGEGGSRGAQDRGEL